MANKATSQESSSKKPGKSLKEKRAAKATKTEAQSVARKAWENK
jgi:hypothetical protein